MTDAEKLFAIEDIKKLKAAYFRCMDTKEWDELATLFTPNVIFDVRGALELPKPDDQYEEPIVQGLDATVDYIRTGLTPLISVHHGHMPEVEILSATEAKAIWPMEDILVPPAGGPFRVFRGYGHYRETYRKDGGKWRIETLKLRRLWVETL